MICVKTGLLIFHLKWNHFFLEPLSQLFSQSMKNSLQATVRAATRTTNSWKSTSPSWFSSSSVIILSTTIGSLLAWKHNHHAIEKRIEGICFTRSYANVDFPACSNPRKYKKDPVVKAISKNGCVLWTLSSNAESSISFCRILKLPQLNLFSTMTHHFCSNAPSLQLLFSASVSNTGF